MSEEDLPSKSGPLAPGLSLDLLLRLRQERHSGLLSLRSGQRWKDVVWVEGQPVWADGDAHGDRLGTMLLDEGVLSRAQYEAAVAAMSTRALDFGSALTELGYLTPTALYGALRRLVLRRVAAAVGWQRGTFSLSDELPRQCPNFGVSALLAVLRGAQAHADLGVIQEELDRQEARFVRPTPALPALWAELAEDGELAALGPFLDGRRSIGQLRSFSILDRQQLDPLLWVLHRAGGVSFVDTAERVELRLLGPQSRHPLTDLSARIIADYLRYWQRDFFAILGCSPDDSPGRLAAAAEEGVLSWTPEGLPEGLPLEVASKARALYAWVESARETLADPELCASYRGRLDEGLTGLYRRVERPEAMEASMLFQVGQGFMRARNFAEAERSFSECSSRVPDAAEYLAYLGYATYRRRGPTAQAAQEARETLRAALESEPQSSTAWFFLGLVAQDQRDYGGAVEAFSRSLRFDPSSQHARRALAQAEVLVQGTRGPL